MRATIEAGIEATVEAAAAEATTVGRVPQTAGQDRPTADRAVVVMVDDGVGMIFVWPKRVMCGRKIAVRIVGKTDGPIDVRIAGRTAEPTRVANFGVLIEPIKWPVSMVNRDETVPVPSRWSGPIVPSASNVCSGLSDPIGHRDRNVRRSRNGVDGTRLGRVVDYGIDSGAGRFARRRCVISLSCLKRVALPSAAG
jgi:hypothetical protein